MKFKTVKYHNIGYVIDIIIYSGISSNTSLDLEKFIFFTSLKVDCNTLQGIQFIYKHGFNFHQPIRLKWLLTLVARQHKQ